MARPAKPDLAALPDGWQRELQERRERIRERSAEALEKLLAENRAPDLPKPSGERINRALAEIPRVIMANLDMDSVKPGRRGQWLMSFTSLADLLGDEGFDAATALWAIHTAVEQSQLCAKVIAGSPILETSDALWEAWRASDNDSDTAKKSWRNLPDNSDVLRLCKLLQRELPKGRSQSEIAREMTGELPGDEREAQNLLRQARRFPHLWKPS